MCACISQGQLGLGDQRKGRRELFPVPLLLPPGDYDETDVALGKHHSLILATVIDRLLCCPIFQS